MVSGCVVAGSLDRLDVHERKAQKSYWEEHSGELNLEAIMLDSRAAELDKEERPEVIYPATIFFTRLFLVLVRMFVIHQLEHDYMRTC
jgi:hypothetical protein